MRLAILANPDSWYFRDLRRAAEPKHEVTLASFRELISSVGELLTSKQCAAVAAGEVDMRQMDAVLVRTMPPGSLEQVVFRMDALAQLEAAGVVVLNPPKSIEVAVDKYLALARMAAAGLLVPRTVACQTVDQALAAFELLGGDVVVKPLFGAEGRGIARINDAALAQRAFSLLAGLGAVLYVQQFILHDGFDIRVLLVGERSLVVRRRHSSDWRTNVSRGAVAEQIEPRPEWIDLARRAAAAVGAPIAGVDLLPAQDGQVYALEVNAVPGWMALARATGVDVARLVVDYVELVGLQRNRR
ncbi:MAG: RimK family alpha-L-glutamate ligase [Pirellulales bacterium]|nr:RimK family alpha-L-glutamate ligase [Pirellulales bacterium]